MAVAPNANGSDPAGSFTENARAVRDDVQRGRSELRAIGARGAEITEDLRELARLEAELAKAEVAENRKALQTGVMSGAAAGVFGFWLLGFLGTAMMFGLAEFLELWLAALVTAGTFLLVAVIAALMARSRFRKFSPTPQRTIASIKEDLAWLRRLTKRNAASANNAR